MKKQIEQPKAIAHGAAAHEEDFSAKAAGSINNLNEGNNYDLSGKNLSMNDEFDKQNDETASFSLDNSSAFENNSEESFNEETSELLRADNNSNGNVLSGTKFRDAKTLLDAYDNLHSEFTKKCQAYAELKKEQEKLQSNNIHTDELAEFLKENPKAVPFADKIIQKAKEQVPQVKNPIKLAFLQVAAENLQLPNELIKDEQFIKDYVLKSDDIKQKIISEYFEKVNFERAPALIASHPGSGSPISPCNKPKSLHEAGVAARAMLSDK